jgi:hypothetical protein
MKIVWEPNFAGNVALHFHEYVLSVGIAMKWTLNFAMSVAPNL